MSLAQAVKDLKQYSANPEENVAEIAKILDELLDSFPTLEEIEESKIKLQIKIVGKKSQSSVIKEKAEALLSKFQNVTNEKAKQQLPARSHSKDMTQDARDKIKTLFLKELEQATTDKKKAKEIAALIEDALFQEFPSDTEYQDHAKELVMAIKKKDQIFHLTKNLLSGALSPLNFARMTQSDFQTPEEKRKQEEIAKEAMNQTTMPKMNKTPSRIFQCPKCKSMETWFYQLQTRGGDEPMTNFCECLNCGHSFKR